MLSLLRNLLFGGTAIGLTAGCKLSKWTFCFCFLFSPGNADPTQRKHTLGMEWFWQYSDRNQASFQCSPTCQVGFQILLVSSQLTGSTPGRLPCWIPGTRLVGTASSQSSPLLHWSSLVKVTDLRAAVLGKPSSLSLLSGGLGNACKWMAHKIPS